MGLVEAIEKGGQVKTLPRLPFRAPENVRARHELMVSLHQQGLKLYACAQVAGLKDHSTAWWHIHNHCRCQR